MGAVSDFLDRHFRHFNARETVAAAGAYRKHVDAGGRMLVSLAGAMSTAEIGTILARAIRADMVHAICSTGANAEEDLFNLLAGDRYRTVPDWRGLSARDEAALRRAGMNRVTDTCIPEDVMLDVERVLKESWRDACRNGRKQYHWEYLYSVLREPGLLEGRDVESSWMLAAMEKGLPVYVPGWEDSTIGNAFTACVLKGGIPSHDCVRSGTEQFAHLIGWYEENCRPAGGGPSVGFLQVGGGIAGDFAICAVPAIVQDLGRKDTPLWGYFAQVSDAVTSYGGYSGAVPNEKITWAKLGVDTPRFMIQSDATIVVPLILGYVLGD